MSFQHGAFQVPGFQINPGFQVNAGSGQSKTSPNLVPQPAYEEKKQKPFRPVWDKPRQGEIEQQPAAPLPPAGIFTPGMPPAELFATKGLDPAALDLPRFDHLVPGDVDGLSHRLRNAMDSGDAEAALRAFAEQQQQPAPRPPQVGAPAPAPAAPPRPPPSTQDIAEAIAVLAAAGLCTDFALIVPASSGG